ncbi:MAG: DUF6773 family protein [bacterium]|jgi:hypothetical protein
MKNPAKQDERIIALRRESNSKAFALLYIGLIAVMLRRMYILQQTPEIDLLLLFVATSAYLVYQNIVNGTLATAYINKRTFAGTSVVSAVIAAVVYAGLSLTGKDVSIPKAALMALVYLLVFAGTQAAIYKWSEYHANKDIE